MSIHHAGRTPPGHEPAKFMHTLLWTFWNSQEHRLRAALRILIQYVVWIVAAALLHRAVNGPFGWLISTFFPVLTPISAQLVQFSMSLTAALASTWLVTRYIDRRPFQDLGLHVDASWWLDMVFGMALGAMLMTMVFALEYRLGWISIRDRFSITMEGDVPFAVGIIGPIVVFVVVGVTEEVLTRGYQLRNMAEGFNVRQRHPELAIVLAWLLSSFIFGLLHALNPNATWLSTAYLMLAGLFLGLGLILTGRLGLPIGLHITWNFFQGNVFGFPVSGNDFTAVTFIAIDQGGPELWTGGAFGPEAGLIGISAIVLGCFLTLLWVRIRYGHLSLYRPYAFYTPRQPLRVIADGAE